MTRTKHLKRVPHGRPIPGTDIVNSDVIALLSGVNYSSVEKVLAAIRIIQQETGASFEDIVEFTSAATQSVRPDDPEYGERAKAALSFCQEVARDEDYAYTDYVLHLHRRFTNHS